MKRISVLPPRSILIAFSLAILCLPSTAVPALGNPETTGACCFADGSCQILAQADCAQQGGVWMGEGLSCEPNPCPGCLLPCFSGACCLPDGRCEWVPDPTGTQTITTWGKIKTMYR